MGILELRAQWDSQENGLFPTLDRWYYGRYHQQERLVRLRGSSLKRKHNVVD
jgi:hypothetical protein